MNSQEIYARSFSDFGEVRSAKEIQFYTDSSGSIGCGGYCNKDWFAIRWDQSFLIENSPKH